MQSHCGPLYPVHRDVGSGHVALVENVLHRQVARPWAACPWSAIVLRVGATSNTIAGWAQHRSTIRAASRYSDRARPGWVGRTGGGNSA